MWTSIIVCVFWPGECLITRATGEMSDREAERAGLVTTHASAVFMQHVKVGILHSVAATCLFSVCANRTFFLDWLQVTFVEAKERPGLHWAYAQPELQFLFFLLIVSSWSLLKKRRKEQHRNFIILSQIKAHCLTDKTRVCWSRSSWHVFFFCCEIPQNKFPIASQAVCMKELAST